jgi:hypothetical protein
MLLAVLELTALTPQFLIIVIRIPAFSWIHGKQRISSRTGMPLALAAALEAEFRVYVRWSQGGRNSKVGEFRKQLENNDRVVSV